MMPYLSKYFLGLLLFFCIAPCAAQVPDNVFIDEFNAAYQAYPVVPRGILEAISFEQTRFNNLREDQQSSCLGLPVHYGPMGLVANGEGYFRNTLDSVASISGFDEEKIQSQPDVQIMAFAKAYATIMRESGLKKSSTWKDQMAVLRKLSELPSGTAGMNYACDQQLYGIFNAMRQPGFANTYMNDKPPQLDQIFGVEKNALLGAARVDLVSPEVDRIYEKNSGQPRSAACLDYPQAIWAAADPSNYSSRNGTPITAITIHDIEGSYAGAISWFQNPSANVSAHYVLRALDGQITQMVCEVDKAWHVGSENPYTIGFEHEGYANYPGWFTANMYRSSADLARDICADYGINPLRTHYGPPCSGSSSSCQLGGCIKIKGHQMYPNQTHTDPGLFWDWLHYYRLINDTFSVQVFNQSSGTFYDSGGSAGNYGDDERLFWKIAPTGSGSATLTFTAFDLEPNWDYLYIYDGDNLYAPLLGAFTGTASPGTLTAASGRFFVAFRSDCATTAAGWSASWAGASPSNCVTPTGLNAVANAFSATLNWAPVSGSVSYQIRWKQDLESTWHTDVTTASTYVATGLAANAVYEWQVRALCNPDSSAYAGDMFTTTEPMNETLSQCSGTFYDSGGPISTYQNNENYTVVISPTGATSMTVSFSSFDIESGWDYLYIYDGPSAVSPQIPGSPFTGNTSPGTFTTSGGSVTFSFASDGSTVNPGWSATWQCQGIPEASFNISQTTICEGDSLLLQNLSSNAQSYQWIIPGGHPDTTLVFEPYVSFDSSGTYTCTLIAYGSTANDTIQQNIFIQVDPLPVAGFTTQDTVYAPQATALFVNSSLNGSSYLWSFGDSSTSTDVNPWHIYDSTGQYVVNLVVSNNCGMDTAWDTLTVLSLAGVEDPVLLEGISIFPVPFTKELVLTVDHSFADALTCTLHDVRGGALRRKCTYFNNTENRIIVLWRDLDDLAAGVYFLHLQTGQTSVCHRLIKIR